MQYVRLVDFMLSAYGQLLQAELQAKSLQAGYLVQIASHKAPLPVIEWVNRLELDSLTLTFHFVETKAPINLFKKVLCYCRLAEWPPEGIYLQPSSKVESEMSFTITLSREGRNKPLIEPVLEQQTDFYVLTETH